MRNHFNRNFFILKSMFQKVLFIILSVFSLQLAAQNSIKFKGKVIEEKTKLPMEAVTVYVSVAKDSSLIDYTITDKNGAFSFDLKKSDNPIWLKVSMVSFEDYKVTLNNISESKDFGIIAMKDEAKMLGEIVIKSEAPPIRIKKDTLEFNAASFKVRPDSNVQTLLKQLPGVEIDNEGKITVNGKEVNQILVNGKPFFGKDGKVALQNLPSDIINKVQISDTKTKKEELNKQVASSNNASINLTIDEDKNKGFFGKFMVGYGTDKRYESSALVNYFKNKRKINVLASSNNINSVGFSMDEVFDNMGGGRNMTYFDAGTGAFGMGGLRFGANGSGITQSDMVGVNYTDEWFKNFETTGSYFYTDQHTKNENRTRQISFLPSGNFITESESNTRSDAFGHNLNTEFEYKIDSTTTISISPKFTKNKAKNSESMRQTSSDELNVLLNESVSETSSETTTNNFKNTLNFNKAFNKKGKYLSFSFDNENAEDDLFNSNNSKTVFHQSGDPDDIRNQVRKTINRKDNYNTDLSYSQPIKDSLNVRLGVEYDLKKNSENRKAFDFNGITQEYSDYNDVLSNYSSTEVSFIKPTAGINIEKKSLNFDMTGGTIVAKFNANSNYLNTITDLSKRYVLPYFSTYLNYKINKSRSIYGNYNYQINFPTAAQVLPVEDLGNPLNTYVGNPDLGLNKNHYLYLSFRDYNYVKKSGYSFYLGGNFYDSQVVSSTSFDINRKRTTTYQNVENTYYTWSGINFNKTIKKEANTFRVSAGSGVNFSMNKGFANNLAYEAFGIRYRANANFTYEYGELLTINPSYTYLYNISKYSNYTIDEASNFQHKLGIQITNYWPKNWVFGNDLGYTYTSNIADGFKKDFYLWNTSLAYSFFNKKFTAKVKVYDVLNQNQSTTRSISATTIRDEQNIVLKRYAMFSLTYKIEKFAGKEKPSRGGGMRMF